MQTFNKISDYGKINISKNIFDLNERLYNEVSKFYIVRRNYDDMLKREYLKKQRLLKLRKKRDTIFKNCKNYFIKYHYVLFHAVKRINSDNNIIKNNIYFNLFKNSENYFNFNPCLKQIITNKFISLTDISDFKKRKKNINNRRNRIYYNLNFEKNKKINKKPKFVNENKPLSITQHFKKKQLFSSMSIFEFKKTHSQFLPNIQSEISISMNQSKKFKNKLSIDKKKSKKQLQLFSQYSQIFNNNMYKKVDIKTIRKDINSEFGLKKINKIKFKGIKINKFGKIKFKKEKSLNENEIKKNWYDQLDRKLKDILNKKIFRINKNFNIE